VGQTRGGPDAELVRDALRGDREPLAELLLRHWRTAAFLAGRVLGSPELGCDAAQEAAVAAMTNLDRLRAPSSFGAWFCGIALNVARRWRRQLSTEVPGLVPDQASVLPGPAEAAEIADVARRVRAAIDQLPPGQREAVLLFYLQGLSHLDVAAELGITRGAVKARLHQGRAALAARLAPLCESSANNRRDPHMTTDSTAVWVDAEVSEIRRTRADDPAERKHIMILTERAGDRWLPIWIGPAEANALALAMESAETPRPFTYRLAAEMVTAAGSGISEIRITKLVAAIFHASVVVRAPGGLREVDARPSDAVNLALVSNAPIKIDASVFELARQPPHDQDLPADAATTADIAADARQALRELYME
jgi:RNA polymerase sigma factor (sigma-70 family)